MILSEFSLSLIALSIDFVILNILKSIYFVQQTKRYLKIHALNPNIDAILIYNWYIKNNPFKNFESASHSLFEH